MKLEMFFCLILDLNLLWSCHEWVGVGSRIEFAENNDFPGEEVMCSSNGRHGN